MPMIDLTVPQGAVDAHALIDDLTKTLLKWEGVPDNPVADGISWGYVHEVAPGAHHVGHQANDDGPARYRVLVTVAGGRARRRAQERTCRGRHPDRPRARGQPGRRRQREPRVGVHQRGPRRELGRRRAHLPLQGHRPDGERRRRGRAQGGRGAPRRSDARVDAAPPGRGGLGGRFCRRGLLRHHSHLLRQRGAAPRARVHDDRGRHPRPPSPPARRGGVHAHRNRRARGARRPGRREGGHHPARAGRQERPALPRADERRRAWTSTSSSGPPTREHEAKVQEILQRVYDNGHVYAGKYEGWYCPRCADFKTENEIGPDNTCPIHKIPLDWQQEENWFFRLSTFQEPLERLYAERPDFVGPQSRYNEALAFIRQGLQDVSLSRSKITWGVRVPWDERRSSTSGSTPCSTTSRR